MKKIILTVGIPASGKSTWAREFVKNKPNEWVIVNRDSIRTMLGNYWVPNRENLVSAIEENSVIEAIKNNYNVIIDATNLNPKTTNHWLIVANRLGCTLEEKLFDIPLKKAIRRDFIRGMFGRKVGKEVIEKFYKKYENYKSSGNRI